MTTIQLPKLSESELKFAQELVSKALINHNKEDISESLNILKKYYDKSNPILDINGFIPHNIHIKGWFSFLLQDCLKPYQCVLNEELFRKKVGFNIKNYIKKLKEKEFNE